MGKRKTRKTSSQPTVTSSNLQASLNTDIKRKILPKSRLKTVMPAPSYQLYKWTLEQLDECDVIVEGLLDPTQAGKYWHSSPIIHALDATTLQTHNGKIYKLMTDIDAETTRDRHGFLPEIITAFTSGFPRNWKALIQQNFCESPLFRKRRDLPEKENCDSRYTSKFVDSDWADEANGTGSLKQQETTMQNRKTLAKPTVAQNRRSSTLSLRRYEADSFPGKTLSNSTSIPQDFLENTLQAAPPGVFDAKATPPNRLVMMLNCNTPPLSVSNPSQGLNAFVNANGQCSSASKTQINNNDNKTVIGSANDGTENAVATASSSEHSVNVGEKRLITRTQRVSASTRRQKKTVALPDFTPVSRRTRSNARLATAVPMEEKRSDGRTRSNARLATAVPMEEKRSDGRTRSNARLATAVPTAEKRSDGRTRSNARLATAVPMEEKRSDGRTRSNARLATAVPTEEKRSDGRSFQTEKWTDIDGSITTTKLQSAMSKTKATANTKKSLDSQVQKINNVSVALSRTDCTEPIVIVEKMKSQNSTAIITQHRKQLQALSPVACRTRHKGSQHVSVTAEQVPKPVSKKSPHSTTDVRKNRKDVGNQRTTQPKKAERPLRQTRKTVKPRKPKHQLDCSNYSDLSSPTVTPVVRKRKQNNRIVKKADVLPVFADIKQDELATQGDDLFCSTPFLRRPPQRQVHNLLMVQDDLLNVSRFASSTPGGPRPQTVLIPWNKAREVKTPHLHPAITPDLLITVNRQSVQSYLRGFEVEGRNPFQGIVLLPQLEAADDNAKSGKPKRGRKKQGRQQKSTEKPVKRKSGKIEEDEVAVWQQDEIDRFYAAKRMISPHIDNYWGVIAARVGTKSVEECLRYDSGDVTDTAKKPKRRKRTARNDIKPRPLAKKGTIRRNQQLRDVFKSANDDYDGDDLFNSPQCNGRGRQIRAPLLNFTGDSLANLSRFSTPGDRMLTPFGRNSTLHSDTSNAVNSFYSPGFIDRSTDQNEADKYVYHLQQRKRLQQKFTSTPTTVANFQSKFVSTPKLKPIKQTAAQKDMASLFGNKNEGIASDTDSGEEADHYGSGLEASLEL